MSEIIKNAWRPKKSRYKTRTAGVVNPLSASSSPPVPPSPYRYPEGSVQVLRYDRARRRFQRVLVVGRLGPRISDLTPWKCGIDLRGRTSSTSFLLPITTYVYPRSSILIARRVAPTELVRVDPPALYTMGEGASG
jgi:hypothetical protein